MEYDQSKEAFWTVSADAGSSHESVGLAADAQNRAMTAYAAAVRRLNEFLLDGRISYPPQDTERHISNCKKPAALAAHA